MIEGLFKTSDKLHPARQIVCPTCQAAIGGACLEPVKPAGSKYVDYYHPERMAQAAAKGQSR